MASSGPTYRLDTLHLEHVLETLRSEHERSKLSRFQRVSFTLLQIAAFTIPLATLVIWLLADVASGSSRFAGIAQVPCVAAAVVLLLAVVAVVILVPLNLPLVRTIVLQARLDRRIGRVLPGVAEGTPRRVRTPSQELGLKIVAGLSLLLVAASVALAITGGSGWHWKLPVALVVFGGPAYFILSKRKIPFIVLRYGFRLLAALTAAGLILAFVFRSEFGLFGFFVVFVVVLLPALLLVSNRYLARSQERLRLLDDLGRLRESLARHRLDAKTDGIGFVELPSDEAERLVEVQTSFIRERRVAAIEHAQAESAAGRTIFKTDAARSGLERLDRRSRLLVESQLEELAFEPQPEGASGDPDSGALRLVVPGTSVEVVYEVADEFRQVRILSVDASRGDGTAAEPAERSPDA